MGNIISFPVGERPARSAEAADGREPGTVVILPVVRVERGPDAPSGDQDAGAKGSRKRRRRAARS